MTKGKRKLIQGLLQEYDIETAKNIQDALKDLLSGTVQKMLEAEMDDLTRQISETIVDIYGFVVSEEMVSNITDRLLPQIKKWQNRPLVEVYPILFIDAVYFSVRDEGIIRKLTANVVLGINVDGEGDVIA